jgi:hypothetical protein
MIHFLSPAAQDDTVKEYLGFYGRALQDNIRILHYEDLAQRNEFETGTYVLSALDQLSQGQAQLVRGLYEQLNRVTGVRLLNDPSNTLQRYELLRKLKQVGKNEFTAIRSTGDFKDLRYPVFLREESLHEGAISPLLTSESEIREALGRAIIQGHQLKRILIVEFCDTSDEAGFYRKYAAFVVGKRIIARSLNYGRDWMLKHAGTEFTLPMIEEEIRFVKQNPHRDQLSEIFELAQVEYGRIDYAIANGRVQTWEINLHPTIGRGLRPPTGSIPPELDRVREEVKLCFYEGFDQAWREVDLHTESKDSIPINFSREVIRAATTPDVSHRTFLNAVKKVLRPAKPVIVPLSQPFLFGLGYLAHSLKKDKKKQLRADRN